MDIRAFICGCAGLSLTKNEIVFLRESRPWGLILFGRNVASPEQVAALVRQFRAVVQRANAPVLIDQEGGRVQRLKPPYWRAYPSAATLALLAGAAEHVVRASARLMANDLHLLGISIDCLPVLDVPVPGSHMVIGDRAYAGDVATVARLGGAAAESLLAGGILPVMKHIPGHGRADADTHLALPVVRTLRHELAASDFSAFALNRRLPIAMTAHVIYADIDPHQPATTSPIVVREIIRGMIGFDGLLISDDLSMRALQGSFAHRTAAMFAAGVDIALHCNGDLHETHQIVAATPWLIGRARDRAEQALARISAPEPFDAVDAGLKLDMALAMVPAKAHSIASKDPTLQANDEQPRPV